jgi:aromatic ring-opening dioxygenase LigB subunit
MNEAGTIPFACLAPHGWLSVPLLCGPDDVPARETCAGLEELGRRAAAFIPDTIVLITPHGLMAEGSLSLLDSPTVAGTTEGMPWAAGSKHSVRLEFEVDRELNAAIAAAAPPDGVPVARVTNHSAWEPLPLDFGSLIPLWFIGAALQPRPRVVIMCPDRRIRPIDPVACIGVGETVREAVAATGRRVAFIASGDLAHAHDANHAYGFDPAAALWDAAVCNAVRANDLEQLLTFDPDARDRAKTDAFGPLMCLHGLLKSSSPRAELLSYEAPTYFGMACGVWS